MPTINRHRPLVLHVSLLAACALALSACNGAAAQDEDTAASSSAVPVAPATTSSAPSSSTAPSSKAAVSSAPAIALDDPKEVAIKAMALFARPDEPERRWFSELRPYLEEEYAVEAEYIDPVRIPFDKIISGPVMGGDSDNPQVATAGFKTDAGPWYVELHQNVPGGDWLVGGIGSADE
ncbi:hypothetical protein [Arthrobacter rhombi]|uniref:hypothetical protein n=1 Tax=Arthrobacter rhombi TaxID=71253 RepID=UPI003FD09630